MEDVLVRRILVLSGLVLGTAVSGCGEESSTLVSGTGVIEEISSIEFVGVALNDRTMQRLYDLSGLPDDQKELGSIVRYEGKIDEAQVLPAGVPERIDFTQFDVIGIEN